LIPLVFSPTRSRGIVESTLSRLAESTAVSLALPSRRTKSRARAKVEHPFRILKRIFGFDKMRYRGLAKNHNRLCACFALVNLYLHRKRLIQLGSSCL
jgi:IS5 family transposase